MATATLTDPLVRNRKPPTDKAVEEIRDKNTPGFVLRITKSDKRTFSAVGRVDGKQIRVTIGRYPIFSLAKARARARDILGDMADGIDPRKDKKPRDTFGAVAALSRCMSRTSLRVMSPIRTLPHRGRWSAAKHSQ